MVSIAALIGCGTLWQQRGLLERRADLAESAGAEQRRSVEFERVRADLEHEQQYSALIQDQLARAREQLERERVARRAAERELDALTDSSTGTDTGRWKSGAPTVLLTVEEPGAERPSVAAAEDPAAEEKIETAAQPSTTRPLIAMSAAQRRGWQVVDGEAGSEDDDEDVAEAERLYRPFIDQLSAAVVPVSDAALAMAPVIGAGTSATDLDGVLDLTAYDETAEFSLREVKGLA
jgi:hypothetical protein